MPSGPAINMGIAIDAERRRRLEEALREASTTNERSPDVRSESLKKAS